MIMVRVFKFIQKKSLFFLKEIQMAFWCFTVWLMFNVHWQHVSLSHLFHRRTVATVGFISRNYVFPTIKASVFCCGFLSTIQKQGQGTGRGQSGSRLAAQPDSTTWPSFTLSLGSLSISRENQGLMASTRAKSGHAVYILLMALQTQNSISLYTVSGRVESWPQRLWAKPEIFTIWPFMEKLLTPGIHYLDFFSTWPPQVNHRNIINLFWRQRIHKNTFQKASRVSLLPLAADWHHPAAACRLFLHHRFYSYPFIPVLKTNIT